MSRGKTRGGRDFSLSKVKQVWAKARGTGLKRRDICGAGIHWSEHGRQTRYGWEIDHKRPVSRGGSDDLSNLQPLHWQNNRDKADRTQGEWNCGR